MSFYEDMDWDVYYTRNLVNGKGYIGITTKGLQARLSEHVRDSVNGSRSALHAAIRKYGWQSFEISLLARAHGLSAAQELESKFILDYDTYASGRGARNGYNMSFGGEQPDLPWES